MKPLPTMSPVSYWDDERTQLSTPEQVDLQLEVANVGSRGLAVLFDLAVRYGVILVLYAIMQIVNASAGDSLGTTGFTVLFILIVFVTEWLYFTFFEWIWNGQTPGKRMLRLRVIKGDGSPVSFLEVFLRNLFRPIDTTGPMALFGVAFIFFHPRCQRPGDIVARTIVIREPKIDWSIFDEEPEAAETADAAAADPSRPASSTTSPARHRTKVILTPAEWEMLQRYRHRAAKLDPAVRARLAAQIKTSLLPKAQATDLATAPTDAEAWLEELSRRV